MIRASGWCKQALGNEIRHIKKENSAISREAGRSLARDGDRIAVEDKNDYEHFV